MSLKVINNVKFLRPLGARTNRTNRSSERFEDFWGLTDQWVDLETPRWSDTGSSSTVLQEHDFKLISVSSVPGPELTTANEWCLEEVTDQLIDTKACCWSVWGPIRVSAQMFLQATRTLYLTVCSPNSWSMNEDNNGEMFWCSALSEVWGECCRVRRSVWAVGPGVSHLVSGGLVRGHVTLQLRAVAEGVGTQRAAEALLVLLVAIFDVFLQRRQALVAAVAVRTGEQLGEVVRCAGQQVCRERRRRRGQRSVQQEVDLSCYCLN